MRAEVLFLAAAACFLLIACGAQARETVSSASAPPEMLTPERPRRVVSLDYCADQFVLRLADRDQILAVSPDAGRDFSYMRAEAHDLPRVRSNAEAVMALQPDLVVRAYGGGPGVERLLKQAGVPVAQLGYADDFDGVRANIRGMAQALGHLERGAALIEEMDLRLAAVAGTTSTGLRAFYMTPAGVTTGEGSLIHQMMTAAGLANFEAEAGWRPLPLERLAREQPDLIAAAFFGSEAEQPDAWSSARHPIARRQLRDKPVVHLEGAWTACGGWFLVDAVEALSAARNRIGAPP